MALSAMRTNKKTGKLSHNAEFCGDHANTAPIATESAAADSVTWLAVTPIAASLRTIPLRLC